jgi:Calcium binding
VQEFRNRTRTIRFSLLEAGVFHQASGAEPNQFKLELLRNEAQLHFVSLRSPLDYGHGEGLSRVEMNALRAPLTAPPQCQRGLVCLFLLDKADAFIDGLLGVYETSAGNRWQFQILRFQCSATTRTRHHLSQLNSIDADQSTTKAIGDWHYWVAQGYCF